MSTPRRALAVVLWATAVTLVATTEILHISGAVEGRTYAYAFLGVSGGLAYSSLGLIILRRHPKHGVGWVFVAIGCGAAVHIDALHAELSEVVRRTMQPAHVSLWLRP